MNELFDKHLGAYCKGQGCSQVLTHAIDTWKRSLDNDKFVGTLMMDLSKAFDCILLVYLLRNCIVMVSVMTLVYS